MLRLNDLIMAIICGVILLAINQYIPLETLINLVFNCFMIVLIVLYIMQFLSAIKPILPSLKIFK